MDGDKREAIRALMSRLMEAVEDSLGRSPAVREALADLARRGVEARLVFVASVPSERDGGGCSADRPIESTLILPDDDSEDDAPEAGLTPRDRDFLRSLDIRTESE
jgi:hypothetical protein